LLFVDTWGRRNSLIVGGIITTIGMSLTGLIIGIFSETAIDPRTHETSFTITNIYASYSILAFIYIFIIGYATTWGVIAWIYPSEIFPIKVRSKAISITTASNWGFNYIISLLSPILMEKITWGLYVILASFSVLMVVSVYNWYPETCGYSLEEIDQQFTCDIKPSESKAKHLS